MSASFGSLLKISFGISLQTIALEGALLRAVVSIH